MGEEEKTAAERRMECLGGWGFLMLGFGIIALIPGAILAAVYGPDGSNKTVQIVVATTFAFGLAILFTGLLVTIVWCRLSKKYKPGGKKANDNKGSTTNGQSSSA